MSAERPLFVTGQLVATPAALRAIREAKANPIDYITRHTRGDWGEVGKEDAQENELSVSQGFRILSVYTLHTKVRIWVITEADRSVTTILLPDEY